MIVKFIVTAGRIVFSDEHYASNLHSDVAEENGIPAEEVEGGGLADTVQRRIFGTSYGFGPYDPGVVARILDNWTIEAPSDYV
ncbi:MAG: hypothetical protein A3C93_00975 [Candidatus Lloydbacteria bacterium RIFCSPHIGHO2_02_FULL_54_17]|uniref:Uncharacterized protein n=1 Tax=Candidatus Lloydbacteria bacterium RIFCSPHIGHO2_02_FULL_54_17 TaxID=1798664 RepID=A0A1G2DFB1_9BACT|nr:MAG: hypothetical protein A2762_01550 [Candidatus Lloydbacteria bacterium RIFCSPHIGHO2_01_FULL_54_11]OGZ11560.1 MAG: hypothetical protein A3C93_00975 [Candidatus Lloydbacteria bacterium RIFCSPHIGHO2_02_FULL_54_17]OGZ14842.1 MAG: hypothetical protein A3H76_05170 [Candidatus Lloydbacteria bacterium RIFCSPLOWO2_02_FULL_54_12]